MDYADAIYLNEPTATYGSVELFEFAAEGKYEGSFDSFLARLLDASWAQFPSEHAIPLEPGTPLSRVLSIKADPLKLRYLFQLDDGRVVGISLKAIKQGLAVPLISRMQAQRT